MLEIVDFLGKLVRPSCSKTARLTHSYFIVDLGLLINPGVIPSLGAPSSTVGFPLFDLLSSRLCPASTGLIKTTKNIYKY